ncbi:BnaCnng61240D [Brassica napus]|uniref:BnaCnng61240D protein n=1 Tax=Brassica napus TaxID=3708 RepID=A0A078JTK8_BRANA|nr:BnaCnng61240D [Brassica napus]
MDRMSLLPDDLIFKILSFVPSKVSVSTRLLSKRCVFTLETRPKS